MTTAENICDWLGLDLEQRDFQAAEACAVVGDQWVLERVRPEFSDYEVPRHVALLYAVRRYMSRQAPSGTIENDGFASQGFTNFKDLLDMLRPYQRPAMAIAPRPTS